MHFGATTFFAAMMLCTDYFSISLSVNRSCGPKKSPNTVQKIAQNDTLLHKRELFAKEILAKIT
jgi:hypothetical protein